MKSILKLTGWGLLIMGMLNIFLSLMLSGDTVEITLTVIVNSLIFILPGAVIYGIGDKVK